MFDINYSKRFSVGTLSVCCRGDKMKKRVSSLLLIIIMCSYLCSCNKNTTTDNYIFNIESEKDSGFISATLQMDNENIDNIVCILDDNIVYSRYENEDTVLAFYKYNISNNRTYSIGNIENPYINSGDVVAIDSTIFFYCNEMIIDSGNPDGKIENVLYQIDIVNNKLQRVASDSVEQTLIYLDTLNDNIISFKGKINGDESITYLDLFDNSRENGDIFDLLISKEYNREEENGEILYNFAVNESTIYAIICIKDSPNNVSWAIEEYDCDGNYIASLKLDEKIVNLLKGERISKFEVFGEYGFIRTFSGSGALFSISSNEIIPQLLSETELDIAIPARNENVYLVAIYSRDTGEIWRLDILNNILSKIDLPYEHLNYLYMDNGDVLISSDDTIYGEIDKFPVEKDNLLIQ